MADTNNTPAPPDAVDEIVLDLLHQGSMLPRGKTINAKMFPEAAARIRRLIVEARIDEAERKGENKDYGVVHYNDDGSTFTLLDSRITELQQQLTDGGQQDGKS